MYPANSLLVTAMFISASCWAIWPFSSWHTSNNTAKSTDPQVALNQENTEVVAINFKYFVAGQKFQGFKIGLDDPGLNVGADADIFSRIAEGYGLGKKKITDADLIGDNKKEKFLKLIHGDPTKTNRVILYAGHGVLFPALDTVGHWDGKSLKWALSLPYEDMPPECADYTAFMAEFNEWDKSGGHNNMMKARTSQPLNNFGNSNRLGQDFTYDSFRPSARDLMFERFASRRLGLTMENISGPNKELSSDDFVIQKCLKYVVTIDEIVKPSSSISTVLLADSCHSGAIEPSANVACGASCMAEETSADVYINKNGQDVMGGILSGYIDHCPLPKPRSDGSVTLRELFSVFPKTFRPSGIPSPLDGSASDLPSQSPSFKISDDANANVNALLDRPFNFNRKADDRGPITENARSSH